MGEAQLGPHAGRPVGAAREAVDFSNQCLQALVLSPSSTGRARFPGVVAARGDAERAANRLDLKGGLLPFDELEHGYRIGLVSAAKKAAALLGSLSPGAGAGSRAAAGVAPRALRWSAHR